jgi:hypothetical protein
MGASPPGASEEQIHLACAQWVAWNKPQHAILNWLMHVPNGGKRSKVEACKFKAMGVLPGVPDYILPFCSPNGTYSGFACELKTAIGKVSKEQENWLHQAKTNGWLVSVARNPDQFIHSIKTFLAA